MRIIIIGDGNVGYSLAENLSKEGNNVTIIDKNSDVLKKSDENLDVMCVKGNGASTRTLLEAGVKGADLLIAATTSDELNMVCCLTARKLGVFRTIARIRDPEYASELSLLKEELELDMVINPELTAADEIARILRFPSAISVESFAKGKIEMVEIKVSSHMPIAGMKIKDTAEKIDASILIGIIIRENEVFIPKGDFEIKENDILYIIGKPSSVYSFCKVLGKCTQKIKSVMIVGGGRITYYLANNLSDMGMKFKIIENSMERCLELSELLPNSLIINGDGTDEELLQSENLSDIGAFISMTGNDEQNLISAMLAMQNGVKKVIPKINKMNYIEIAQKKLGIDSVISPKTIITDHILKYVRGLKNAKESTIESLLRVVDGKAEIAEFIAGDSAKCLNIKLKDLKIQKDILIAALVRKNEIIIPHGSDVIKVGDRVIVITRNKNISDINEIVAAGGIQNELQTGIKKLGSIINM
jgi:trk system potassium uptake protein TrkA